MLWVDCTDSESGAYEYMYTGVHKGSRFSFIWFSRAFSGDCAFRDIEVDGDVYECDPVQFPNCEFSIALVEGEYDVTLGDVTFTLR